MRWDELFEELEAEFSAAHRKENDAEIIDMVHAEAATIPFADRLRHRVGQRIQVRLRNGETRQGILDEANLVWSMIHDRNRRFLIPHAAVAFAWPLGGAAPELNGIPARVTLGYALRKLAAAGLDLRVLTDGGELHGRVGMVGADYCDIHGAAGSHAVRWDSIISIES